MEFRRNLTDRAAVRYEIENLRANVLFTATVGWGFLQGLHLALQRLDLDLDQLETKTIAFAGETCDPFIFGFHIPPVLSDGAVSSGTASEPSRRC
jgi:hypothetical protein